MLVLKDKFENSEELVDLNEEIYKYSHFKASLTDKIIVAM